jgi:hypothetical protein
MESRRLAVAVVVSIGLIFAAPFIGQLRAAIRDAVPGQFRVVIGSTIAVAVGLAIVAAIVRIRDRRTIRYAALAVALAVGLLYARVSATGNPDIDVVERFHFVEYGLLALLFYRVWRDREDLGTVVAPLLAALLAAIGDEWFQWFIPARIGEMHDVLMDGVAAACGLLFSLALDPPRRLNPMLAPGTSAAAAAFATAVILVGAAFFHTVHLGYEILDQHTVFLSRFSRDGLGAASRDRHERWRDDPPATFHRLSREDQYLTEGLWHVQRRNQVSGQGDALAAWRENLILETFFTPVLDTPSYATPSGTRWPPEQRADMFMRAAADARGYVSDAVPYPMYTWSRALFWAVIAVTIVVTTWCCRALGRRGDAGRAATP